MTASPTPPEDAPHWARPLLERNIAVAGQLAEGGLEMAMAAKDRALTQDGPVEPAVFEGLSRAYARMARSTRLSLMLQDRQIKDLIAFDKGAAPDVGRDDRKDHVERIVRIIVDPQAPAEESERLVKEGAERLDRETLEKSLLSRPVSELVAIICKDIGLDPDRSRRASEAWATDAAADGDGEWPLMGIAPADSPANLIHGRFNPSG
jgi:hypothetical protein